MMQRCTSIFKRVDIWREGFSALQPNSITVNCFGCLQCVVTPDTLAQVAMISLAQVGLTPGVFRLNSVVREFRRQAGSNQPRSSLQESRSCTRRQNAKECQEFSKVIENIEICVRMCQTTSDIVRSFKDFRFKSKQVEKEARSSVDGITLLGDLRPGLSTLITA